MHNHVKVEPATTGHPDGSIALTVYGKTVILTTDEAAEIAAALAPPALVEVSFASESSDATPA